MAATFGDPVTLSKHDISSKVTYALAPVLASCSKGSKSEYATTGVHGEGINIIDLTSLQPEAATLLGPDSSFACPPVTRVIEKGNTELQRQTYAVLNAAQSKSTTKRSQTLSMWTSTEGLASLHQEHSATLERTAVALYASTSIPEKVVLVSPEGVITTYNSELQQSGEEASSSETQKLLFSFMFESSQCSFARRTHFPPDEGIIVLIVKMKKDFYVRVCSLGQNVEVIGEAPIEILEISSASCNKDGCLALLDKDGTLFGYTIDLRRDGIALTPLEQLKLLGIHPASMSISCVVSTHVLASGFEKSGSDVVLLLWDVRFGVLLAEKKVPRHSALATMSPDHLRLQVVTCGVDQSLLSIYSTNPPARSDTVGSGLKAVVMLVPHTIPTTSSLANAIGRAGAGDKWLAASPQASASGSKSHADGREAMLAGVTEAMEAGDVDLADKIFLEWETEQRALVKAIAKEEAKRQMAALAPKKNVNTASTKDEVSGNGKGDQTEPKVLIKHIPNQIDWGHSFLAHLMRVVLNPKNASYSTKIPSYFLERKLISDGIVEDGVLKCLHEREDWVSIRWALRHTVDVSEDHLMSLLLHVVRIHRKKPRVTKMANSMDVDESAGGKFSLTLPQVFGYVIAYPTSTPPLRLAIRHHFSQVEDAVVLLEVASGWIGDSARKTLTIKMGDMEEELKRGEQTARERATEKDGLPRLDLLVAFISCLLDAVLLDLLQYRRAHQVLKTISTRLAPYAPYLEGLDRLRGPLEPFVQAERRSRRPWEDNKKAQKSREREKDNHTLNTKLYRVEEFFV